MDTAGYLRKHGWRGTGHSLDTNNNGLKKPLLISKKIDVLGIGINKHDVIADQWWMKAFDSSLKDFGTGKKSLLGQVKDHGIRRGGLYGRFVKGEGVPGTYGKELIKSDTSNLIVAPAAEAVAIEEEQTNKKKKRKADGGDEEKEAKKQRKEERADKDARRAAKKSRKEGASLVGTPMDGTSASTSADEAKPKTKKQKQKDSKRKVETLDTLSADKRKQYEERAKEKGFSLEEYFSRRQAKNLETLAITFAEGEKNPWEGRKTEDLTEEERKARRKWMRQRRNGGEPTSDETSGNTSTASASEEKVDEQEEVTAQAILKQSRKKTTGEKKIKADIVPNVNVTTTTSGSFTEEETKAARKAAKKALKDKKEKGKKSKKEQ